jgi:cell division protein ZapA
MSYEHFRIASLLKAQGSKLKASTMDELIPLNLVIGDRNYRVRIQPGDEEVVRKTLKTINDKIVEFKTAFAGKDMQDYIAMVLLWFATEQNTAASNQVNLDNVSSRLQTLEKMIDGALDAKDPI